jgi:hypothetical protein
VGMDGACYDGALPATVDAENVLTHGHDPLFEEEEHLVSCLSHNCGRGQ